MKSMKTERLYLRGYTLEDLPDLHNVRSPDDELLAGCLYA